MACWNCCRKVRMLYEARAESVCEEDAEDAMLCASFTGEVFNRDKEEK